MKPIRNLLLFGLFVTAVVIGPFWYRQGTVANFAKSHREGAAGLPPLDGKHPCVSASLAEGAAVAVSQCATPVFDTTALDRVEVDLRYGAFVLRQTDLQANGQLDLPLTRAYTSMDWLSPNPVHAYGRNSNHSFDMAPIGTRNPYTEIELVLGDGDFVYFKRISPGTGFEDAVYQHTETSSKFYKATINWNGNGWTLRLTDGTEISLPESYRATNLAQGAPTEIRTPSGSKLELRRDLRGNLQEVSAPDKHWMRFTYNDQSRITRAEDDRGDWVRYGYGTDQIGMCLYAIYSSGKERHFQYQGALMTAISDERGTILLRNVYAAGILTRQEFANGGVYQYRYIWSKRGTYVDRAVITFPDGREQEVSPSGSVAAYVKR